MKFPTLGNPFIQKEGVFFFVSVSSLWITGSQMVALMDLASNLEEQDTRVWL
jgi:hypothetical protein